VALEYFRHAPAAFLHHDSRRGILLEVTGETVFHAAGEQGFAELIAVAGELEGELLDEFEAADVTGGVGKAREDRRELGFVHFRSSPASCRRIFEHPLRRFLGDQ
jgi:hypothetical protein